MINFLSESLIYICFALIYFLLDAYHDSNLQSWRNATLTEDIKKYSRRWHTTDAIIKGTVGGLISYLLFDGFNLRSLTYTALFLNIRWIWFDAMLNIFNGLPINYVGSTAFLDRIFNRPGLQFIFKFVILAFIVATLFNLSFLENLLCR